VLLACHAYRTLLMLNCYFTSDERPSKRPRLDRDDDDGGTYKFQQIHNLFWGRPESPHFHTLSTRIPDERTLSIESVPESTFLMIAVPEDLSFPESTSTMLVPKIYETFLELVRKADKDYQDALRRSKPVFATHKTTVITGQPGIGRHIIYYV
jgi:hypothetical protein